jgi:hypothetical protein
MTNSAASGRGQGVHLEALSPADCSGSCSVKAAPWPESGAVAGEAAAHLARGEGAAVQGEAVAVLGAW